MPSLAALASFDAVVRHGTMTAAATERCCAISTISHHVKQMDRFVGHQLLARTETGYVLTPLGRRAYLLAAAALESVEGIHALRQAGD